MLQFCPVCKSLLNIKDDGDKKILYCKCGFKRVSDFDLSYSETRKEDVFKGEGVINESNNKSDILYKCKKCGQEKAELFEGGERLTNESNLYLLKCLNCGHIERKTNSL